MLTSTYNYATIYCYYYFKAVLMKDKLGEPRGFGFVVFESDDIAAEFCNLHNGTEKLILHDREIDFKPAQPRTETKSYKSQNEDKQRLTPDDPAWGIGPAKASYYLTLCDLATVSCCGCFQWYCFVPVFPACKSNLKRLPKLRFHRFALCLVLLVMHASFLVPTADFMPYFREAQVRKIYHNSCRFIVPHKVTRETVFVGFHRRYTL
jgi:hypothetical protein